MKTEDALRHIARTLENRAFTRRAALMSKGGCMDEMDVWILIAEALENVASLLSVEERT